MREIVIEIEEIHPVEGADQLERLEELVGRFLLAQEEAL